MRRSLQLFALIAIVLAGLAPAPPTYAASKPSWAGLIAFVRHDNVWVAQADGTGAQQLTSDGTGTGTVQQRQVSYAYLTWSPVRQRLLVARFESDNPPGGPYRQGWSLETWEPGSRRFVPLVANIDSQDFLPRWSADGRRISYMAASASDAKTTLFDNTIKTADLSGRITRLTGFSAHEGCLDGSTDPSELLFWNLVGPGGVRQTFIWSSTGRYLVYATECIHTGLMYRNLATGRERMVGRWMTEAASSPSGTRLIGVDRNRMVVSNPDGTGQHIFSAAAGARVPVWSPGGRFVYYLTRRTLRTLRYRDHDGNLFEIQVDRASIDRLDVTSGQVRVLLNLPVHAFANLGASPDGKWLYFTQVSNSHELYQHLVHSPKATTALLNRYGPRTDVFRIPTSGGRPQAVAQDSGQVAVSGVGD